MPKRYFENVCIESGNDDSNINDAFKALWKGRIQKLAREVKKNAPKSIYNDLYLGTAGIAYMFYYLATSEQHQNDSTTYLNDAIEVINLKINIQLIHGQNKFICGYAGIYGLKAAIYQLKGDEEMVETNLKGFKEGFKYCKALDFKPDKDELFKGRTGYLFGVLWLEKVFGRKIIPDEDVIELCMIVIKSGRKYSEKNKSIFPLMYSYYNTEYLGAAHGLSAILHMLISFPVFVEKETEAIQDVKKCIDILVSLQTDNGNFPCSMDSKPRLEEDELVHWCHGAPGVVYLLAKAYLVFKEPSYLESCLRCGDLVWTKGLLKKGPGLCHGIAGNGYVFLLLYKLTGDKKHFNRALKFGEFMFTNECARGSRMPDNPFSLFEGLAGTVCYLTDLMQPDKASFPFMDVF